MFTIILDANFVSSVLFEKCVRRYVTGKCMDYNWLWRVKIKFMEHISLRKVLYHISLEALQHVQIYKDKYIQLINYASILRIQLIERRKKEVQIFWLYAISLSNCTSGRAKSGRTSFGIRVGFIGSTHCLHYIYVFICIWDATSELVQLIK
jgi:hypothetical protein